MGDEPPDAGVVRLRRENAELREAVARREGVIAGLQWLMRQSGVPEPLTPDGEPIWPSLHNHPAGTA